MDGAFYLDTRSPFMTSDISSVTLATTDKALYPVANFPSLGANYWWVGKMIMIKLFGRYTTQLTPGNLTIDVYWGTGADANGTVIQASAANALQASQTNVPWYMELIIRCTAIGSSGTLFCTGIFFPHVSLVLSTVQPILIPATAPATSSAIDLTANNIISVQMKYSGSATQSAQVHNMQVIALN